MGQKIDSNRVALIVEDDVELRTLAAALLEETDLGVAEAGSGEEALHYLDDHAEEVTLLFADVRLPSAMSGADLARTVRARWPWIRTILTSGAPLEAEPDLSAVRFMPKPWRAIEVLVEAEKATRNRAPMEPSSHTHA
jgi:CheY-like chemotaxis protein